MNRLDREVIKKYGIMFGLDVEAEYVHERSVWDIWTRGKDGERYVFSVCDQNSEDVMYQNLQDGFVAMTKVME